MKKWLRQPGWPRRIDSYSPCLKDLTRSLAGGATAFPMASGSGLGLARLFLADPDVLVLDEAFSAMDPETESRVRANLFGAFADRAVLAISHRLTGLEQFDRLLLMREGQVHPVLAYFELNNPRQEQIPAT